MNKICWLALVFFAALCPPGRAAEKASPTEKASPAEKISAANRAYLYQREAREVLIHRGWHISRDESGKIVADHPLLPMGAQASGSTTLGLTGNSSRFPFALDMFGWLTLTFRPDNLGHTHCAANIVAYRLERTGAGTKKTLSEPMPYNNPDSTKEIQSMMAQAEKQLAAKRPEYAVH